ncbi:MAG: glycosyltransferase N-terminal domain-containing protein [Pseudorhodobacter sp.]|nr:glycosyltransferase N-terminal domain-containing protein [Pseudorhodobacter sp.]
MAYSLGLTLYNLTAPRDTGLPPDRPARPVGRLIWLHAPQTDTAAMTQLARRLKAESDHAVLLTCANPPAPLPGVTLQLPPGDSPPEARAFLDHWQPDIAVMAGGELRPTVAHEAQMRGVPSVLVNARAPHFLAGCGGWYPGLMRASLRDFAEIWAEDARAAHACRAAGAGADQLTITGRMEEGSHALPCTEAERADLARLLGTRPVWLASDLPQAEEDAVIAAHHAALRLSHRLLLIVVPEDADRAADLAQRLEQAEGWQVARRSAEQQPEPETEVYIADVAAEYGLWYRLAPITYLGGSLVGGGCLRDPLAAAALGSAIIHGPRTGAFAGTFGRLGAARATRAVASVAGLAEAVGDLLSPDRAAHLAQAAWGVASDGVEVTDRLLALIDKQLAARP